MDYKLSNKDLNRLSVDDFHKADKTPITVVLDNIRSHHNVGSVFRCCDAFLVEKAYLCGITPAPPHRDIHKTALGATDTVNWEYYEDTLEVIERLKSISHIIAVEQTQKATPLDTFTLPSPPRPTTLVLGNEVHGVSQEVISVCDEAIEVPQFGSKHSLNISVCAGIVIWELFRKWKEIGSVATLFQ